MPRFAPHPSRRRLLAAGAALLPWPALAAASAATATAATATAADAPRTAWPLKLRHALGETVIARPPQRLLALGWSDAPVARALGAPLVATLQYKPGPDGRNFPWTQPPLAADVAVIPAASVDLELVRSFQPDLILAITAYHTWRYHYAGLAAIAPTLMSSGKNLRDDGDLLTLRIGQALDRQAQAQALVAQARAARASFKARHASAGGQPQKLLIAQVDDEQFLPMLDESLPARTLLAELGLQLAGLGPDGALIGDGQFQCNGARAQPLQALASIAPGTRLIGLPFGQTQASKVARSLAAHQRQGRLAADAAHPAAVAGDRWLHDALLAPNPVNTPFIIERLQSLLHHGRA